MKASTVVVMAGVGIFALLLLLSLGALGLGSGIKTETSVITGEVLTAPPVDLERAEALIVNGEVALLTIRPPGTESSLDYVEYENEMGEITEWNIDGFDVRVVTGEDNFPVLSPDGDTVGLNDASIDRLILAVQSLPQHIRPDIVDERP